MHVGSFGLQQWTRIGTMNLPDVVGHGSPLPAAVGTIALWIHEGGAHAVAGPRLLRQLYFKRNGAADVEGSEFIG